MEREIEKETRGAAKVQCIKQKNAQGDGTAKCYKITQYLSRFQKQMAGGWCDENQVCNGLDNDAIYIILPLKWIGLCL